MLILAIPIAECLNLASISVIIREEEYTMDFSSVFQGIFILTDADQSLYSHFQLMAQLKLFLIS